MGEVALRRIHGLMVVVTEIYEISAVDADDRNRVDDKHDHAENGEKGAFHAGLIELIEG